MLCGVCCAVYVVRCMLCSVCCAVYAAWCMLCGVCCLDALFCLFSLQACQPNDRYSVMCATQVVCRWRTGRRMLCVRAGCQDEGIGVTLKNLFETPYFRCTVVKDAGTVECCGALKAGCPSSCPLMSGHTLTVCHTHRLTHSPSVTLTV